MKITYLHQYYNRPTDSGSTRSYEMARRLARDGHEVTMITSYRLEGRGRTFETNDDGVRVIWIPVKYNNKLKFFGRIYSFLKFAIFSTFKTLRVKSDIIFATSTPLTIAIPALAASFVKKIPFVFEVRDLWPEMPIAVGALRNPILIWIAKKLELITYKKSAAIIALSPGMKEGIIKCGINGNKVALISNACDIDKFSTPEKLQCYLGLNKSDGPILVYAGTLGELNGVSYLVDIARELDSINSNVRIIIIGDGAEREALINKAISLSLLSKNLFIFEPIPKSEMPLLMGFADMGCSLFVDIPEMRANSANKFFDTLAAGKPIMINYGGWMHDLIVESKCGISIWGETFRNSAFMIDKFLNNKNNISEASMVSLQLAKTFFEREMLYQKLQMVLHASVKGNGESAEFLAPDLKISNFLNK